MSKKKGIDEVVIKSTKYCNIVSQAKVTDNDYTYAIEKIYIKSLKRYELRFCVYKDIVRGVERYIPRSLDVTELELIELIRTSLKENVFSSDFIEMLKQEVNKS